MNDHNPIPAGKSRPLPLVRVSGTHREIGRQIGEACRTQIRHSLVNARSLLVDAYEQLQLTWESAIIQSHKYMPFAQEQYPQYIEEIAGIAEGADVVFDELAMLNAMEALTTEALHLTKCTSVAVNQDCTADGHVLLAHNEDWVPEDEPDAFIIHASPLDEPPFLAMSYGGFLPTVGFNACGIAQSIDSVYPNDCRIGIPRTISARAVLASRTPSDAIRHMLISHRAAGFCHLLVHESGEIYAVEVSARKFAILYAEDGYLVHTNHYLDPSMRTVESEPDELISTRVRYARALRLVRATRKHTIQTLQAIQKDHINFQDSICNHAENDASPLEREKTITALLMDLTSRQMHAAWGNPCQNAFHTYQLDG